MTMLRNLVINTIGSRQLLVNFVATLLLLPSQPTLAQTKQKTFSSAGQASRALYDAVRNGNDQTVQAILGSPELASSGDEAEDKLEREQFAEKYQEMHRLVREPDGSAVLYIGAENWPFPVPLVATDGKWSFDSDAGSQEVRAREVGENEADAIEVCHTITGSDVAKTDTNDTAAEFARRIVKSPPVTREVFRGYYFRVSKARPGETAVVAYPTDYRASGVMTFVVSGGTVYERDLGPQTPAIAQSVRGKLTGEWSQVQ